MNGRKKLVGKPKSEESRAVKSRRAAARRASSAPGEELSTALPESVPATPKKIVKGSKPLPPKLPTQLPTKLPEGSGPKVKKRSTKVTRSSLPVAKATKRKTVVAEPAMAPKPEPTAQVEKPPKRRALSRPRGSKTETVQPLLETESGRTISEPIIERSSEKTVQAPPRKEAVPTGSVASSKQVVVSKAPAPLSPTLVAKQLSEKLKLPIPSILLEGDEPVRPARNSGPGEKYAVGPAASPKPEPMQELPRSYGTGRITLTARDPYCLYAYWDFTDEQLNFYNARSVHQHLVIRVQEEATRRQPIPEVHLHADSRHWFLHVPSAGVSYVAEIGYYEAGKGWVGIAHSSPVSTPVASMSEERQVQFAVFSPEPAAEPRSFQTYREQPHAAPRWSMEQREFRQEQFEPAQSRAEAPRHWEAHAPGPDPGTGLQPRIKWTSLQENALEEIIHLSLSRHEWLGSMEIAEWSEQRELRERQLVPTPPVVDLELPGPSSLELGISSPTGEEQISSPIRSEQKPERGFWFNVNAELIIYGATDPTARVTIGGRPIRLRPDGTFSYRFALPDGQCELPAVAVSTDDDTRSAALKFSRSTDYTGEVGAHPQDASLRKPSPENVE